MKKSLKLLALLLVALFCLQAVPVYAAGLTMRVKDALEAEEAEEAEEADPEEPAAEEAEQPRETPTEGVPFYENTKAFTAFLDEFEIEYTVVGLDSDYDELVRLDDMTEDGTEYTINIYFSQDEEQIGYYVWYVIEYDEKDFADVVHACNQLNNQYKFLTFYADESDDSVTASMNLIVRKNDEAAETTAEIAVEAVVHIENILSSALPLLQEYAK